MHRALLLFILAGSLLGITRFHAKSDEYDLATIYKGIDAKADTKATSLLSSNKNVHGKPKNAML